MSPQVISVFPAQAGTLVLSLVTLGAYNHHSLQLIAHDLPPKSRVETQVKIRLEFANMPVALPGVAATAGGTVRWQWLRLPFTASVKQPRYFDHGMCTTINARFLFLILPQIPLSPNQCCIYTLLQFVLVSHTCQPLVARSVTHGKPNAGLSTTQTPIHLPALLISPVSPYSTCQVEVSICRSVRAFLYTNDPKW